MKHRALKEHVFLKIKPLDIMNSQSYGHNSVSRNYDVILLTIPFLSNETAHLTPGRQDRCPGCVTDQAALDFHLLQRSDLFSAEPKEEELLFLPPSQAVNICQQSPGSTSLRAARRSYSAGNALR